MAFSMKILLPVLGLSLLAAPAGAADYTITAIKSLTGGYAFVGVPEANAIKQAVEELNARNFLGEGNRLKLNVYDDASDRGQLLSLMNRSALDDTLVILGTANSAFAIGFAPALNDLKVPFIATAQTAQPVSVSPWHIKITPSPQGSVQPIADYAADKLKINKLVIIYCRDNEGHTSNMRIFRDHLATKGTKPVLEETILISDTDFAALATKVAQADPDSIWLGANAAQAANLVLQLKQAGVSDKTAFIGTAGLGIDYIATGGKAVDNTYMNVDYNPERQDPLNLAFIDGYKKRYNTAPENFAGIGYSETLIAASAIKASLPDPTREKVLAAIKATKDHPVVIGSDGKWTMGADGIPTYKPPVMVIRDGKMTTAP